MSYSFRIFAELGIVATRLSGVVTASEFRNLYRYVKMMPGYRPEFPEISDFRHVDVFEFGHEVIGRLARHVDEIYAGSRLKTAIIAEKGLAYGMARTYQTHATLGSVEEVEIFAAAADAFAWAAAVDVPEGFERFGLS